MYNIVVWNGKPQMQILEFFALHGSDHAAMKCDTEER
jgi:hypothetical protein